MSKLKPSSVDRLPVPVELIERRIYLIRGHKVMLDSDLAELYQEHRRQTQPQLTTPEAASLRFQLGMSKTSGRGGSRYFLAFVAASGNIVHP